MKKWFAFLIQNSFAKSIVTNLNWIHRLMEIKKVTSVRTDIEEMLSKIRDVSSRTTVFSAKNSKIFNAQDQANESTKVTHAPFADVFSLLKDSLANVSLQQQNTEHLQNAYLMGEKNVSLSQVIVASQKSKLAFEGLISVRNKILEAYKDIMSMNI